MPKKKKQRECPEGTVPLIDVEGTTKDAGVLLGYAWQDALPRDADRWPTRAKPWWRHTVCKELVERIAPHLPVLYRGMAQGAGIPDDRVSTPVKCDPAHGCTSFAIHPRVTLEGRPISGQTKDTSFTRILQYQVLRLRLLDAPSALTLTYPGWLYGHGFVAGGCAIFRNSLYAGPGRGRLPYFVWGILALHCSDVEQVARLTKDYGVQEGAHCTVADEKGGIIGIEIGRGGVAILKPTRGIYTHANAVASGPKLAKHQETGSNYLEDSGHRAQRLWHCLELDSGRITAQLAFMAMCDHDGYPRSICPHEGKRSITTAAVVVEPARGLLHVCRGNPCQNWPETYALNM